MTIVNRFSYLHFAVGVIVYYWGVSLKDWFMVHTIFELLENTQFGMDFINNYFKLWPGGKSQSDPLINSVGDTIAAMMGWWSAQLLDV